MCGKYRGHLFTKPNTVIYYCRFKINPVLSLICYKEPAKCETDSSTKHTVLLLIQNLKKNSQYLLSSYHSSRVTPW